MPVFDELPGLIYSPLCREYAQDGYLLEIQIYRLENRETWRLEVVNEQGTSVLWNEKFADDYEADEAFREKIYREGIEVFLDNEDLAGNLYVNVELH